MTVLLDANVLVALTVQDHVHHDAAERWLSHHEERFATCPITQGTLLRLLLRGGARVDDAWSLLRELGQGDRHEFWADNLSYEQVRPDGVVGHRQVTDAYLAELARQRGGRLATFDRGLAALHPDVSVALPHA